MFYFLFKAGAYISKAFEGNTGSGGVLQIDIRNIIDTSNMPGMVNKLLYEVVIRAPVEGAKNVNLNVFLVKVRLDIFFLIETLIKR